VAVAAAIPLWLVLDDGGVRRLGAIDAATTGQAGQLTLAGVNGGAPIPIDSFAFRLSRPVGATQPERDSIEVTLPLGTSMTQLVGRAASGAKSATGKVELVRSINGTLTAYLTFVLVNVSLDGFDDSYQLTSSGAVHSGAENIVLRYEAMTMTCPPSTCAEPTHQQGTSTELAVLDLGTRGAWLESGNLSVPKNLKEGGAAVLGATMQPNYLLPGLLAQARDGKRFENTVQVDLVRQSDNTARKTATYKLGAAAVTSLAIGLTSQDVPVVQVEFSSGHFGVTTYAYTATGAPDKSATVCFPSCTGL
jgi:hypothetical protein